MNNSLSARFKAALLGLAYSLTVGAPVWADDTEIYFGSAFSNNSVIRPNVLLVLDTSSSMTNMVDGTGLNRLDNMKQALHAILDNASNVNVGLMRFHKRGGPVLYPVAPIDADVCEVEDCDAGTSVVSRVATSADDAEQALDGTMSLDQPVLDMVTSSTTT